jgi:hypothetical protein
MNTRYGIVTMVLAVVVYLGLQFVPDNLVPWRGDKDAQVQAQLETAFSKNDSFGLFAYLKQEFPVEYDIFLSDLSKKIRRSRETGDALRRIGFEAGQTFTLELRRKNAHYLSSAPVGELRTYHLLNLAFLESLRDESEICARFAAFGGAGFNRSEAMRFDLELISKASLQTYRAIVAGRDAPQPHEPANAADWAQVRSDWELRSAPTDSMKRAFYDQEVKNPSYCEAMISFQRFIATDQSPSTVRALVAASVSAAQQ